MRMMTAVCSALLISDAAFMPAPACSACQQRRQRAVGCDLSHYLLSATVIPCRGRFAHWQSNEWHGCCGVVGLRLRGGAPGDSGVLNVEASAAVAPARPRKNQRSMEVVSKNRAKRGKVVGETLVEQAASVVPGITDLLPSTLTELRRKQKLNQMGAEDAEVLNLLAQQERGGSWQAAKMRPRKRKGGALATANATTIETATKAVEREMHSLRREAENDRVRGSKQDHAKILAKLEYKHGLLLGLARDLELKKRYAAVHKKIRNDAGSVVCVIKNHSVWLDAVDEGRLDDVDEWHLGLCEVPSSRFVSAWDKHNLGRTLRQESQRRVVRNDNLPKDRYMGSARTLLPLPQSGVHYFEVVIRADGGSLGSSLGGGNYIGLVDGNVTNWDGCWEFETTPSDCRTAEQDEWGSSSCSNDIQDWLSGPQDQPLVLPWTLSHSPKKWDGSGGAEEARERRRAQRSRRLHIMAMHDACCRAEGEVTWSSGT